MTDYFEMIKEFDINNMFELVIISILLIIIYTSCVQSFFASGLEIVLMNKGDELKRVSFIYVISFLLFCLANYMIVQDVSFVLVNIILLVLGGIAYGILYIIRCCGRAKRIFAWYKENIGVLAIIVIFPIVIYFISVITGIKMISSVILCSLVECILVASIYTNVGKGESSIIVNIDNTKWYVFKRIDDSYLLCGDRGSIELSTKTKLLLIEDVAKYYFERENKSI